MFYRLRNPQLLGGSCLLMPLAYFIGQLAAQLASKAPYSMREQTISELGFTACGEFTNPISHATHYVCSPLHAVLNSSFVLAGTGIVGGSWFAVAPQWPGRRMRSVGIVLVLLAGCALVGAGLTPGDKWPSLHKIAGGIQFSAQTFGMVLLGFAALRHKRSLAWLSLACGFTAFIGLGFQGTPPFYLLGHGGWQRIAAYPVMIWSIVIGVSTIRQFGSKTPESSLYGN